MTSQIDYPNLRAATVCVLCRGNKDEGLIVCWPCHREHLRNGATAETTRILDASERNIG